MKFLLAFLSILLIQAQVAKSETEEVLILCGDRLRNMYLNTEARILLFNDLKAYHETYLSNYFFIEDLVNKSNVITNQKYRLLLEGRVLDKTGLEQLSRLADGALTDEEIPYAIAYLYTLTKFRAESGKEAKITKKLVDNVFLLKTYGFLEFAKESPVNIRNIKDYFTPNQSMYFYNVILDLLVLHKKQLGTMNEAIQRITIALSKLPNDTAQKLVSMQKLYKEDINNDANPLKHFHDFRVLDARYAPNYSSSDKGKPLEANYADEAAFRINLLLDYLENKTSYGTNIEYGMVNKFGYFEKLMSKGDTFDVIWRQIERMSPVMRLRFYEIALDNEGIILASKKNDPDLYLSQKKAHKILQELAYSMIRDKHKGWDAAMVATHSSYFHYFIKNHKYILSLSRLFDENPKKRRVLLRDYFLHFLMLKDNPEANKSFLDKILNYSKSGVLANKLNDIYDPGSGKFLFTTNGF